jgi:hypothetical protein
MVKTNAAWSAGHDAAPTTPTKLLATIAVPGSPLASYDIGSVDPVLEHYFLSDRSNAALDIIDTRTNHVIGQVKGFSGSAGGNNNLAGPDGNAPTGDGLVWAGNGDSTVKVVDSRSMTIVQSISTGGTMRADEMSYDSKDRILLVANDADSPPFVSLIYTPDGYRQVLARISFKNATNGIEASVFDAAKGLFYVNIPQVGGSGHQGEVAVIDPILKKVIKTIPVRNCEPSGLALGPDQNLLLGCSTTNDANATPLPAQIISARSGLMLGSIPIGGSDQSIYDPGDKRYYLAARDNASGPVLGVVDALTRTLAASISTSTNSHSVAADPSNNHVFVPLTAGSSNAVCPNGCVAVYGR